MSKLNTTKTKKECTDAAYQFLLFTVHNDSCGKVMFSQACVKNSVHRRVGVCPKKCWDTPPGRQPSWQTPPQVDTPQADIPWADIPPNTTGYGQQAGGTHPTGMHSCLVNNFSQG